MSPVPDRSANWPEAWFLTYPDSHPGWDALMRGVAQASDRHPPGHCCPRCEDTRTVHDLAVEIVQTFEGTRHPALSAIVRRLKQALRRST